jgi:hypothetical protein
MFWKHSPVPAVAGTKFGGLADFGKRIPNAFQTDFKRMIPQKSAVQTDLTDSILLPGRNRALPWRLRGFNRGGFKVSRNKPPAGALGDKT